MDKKINKPALKKDLEIVRGEMKDEFKGVRSEMKNEFKSVRKEMSDEFKSVRTEMSDEFKSVRKEMSKLEENMKQNLDEAVEAILGGMNNIALSLNNEIKENRNRIDKLEMSFKFIREDMKDIKVEFSKAPSREEFEELKRQVLTS